MTIYLLSFLFGIINVVYYFYVCMMLRQTPETSIGTSIVRKKRHPRYSSPEKEEWKGWRSVESRKGRGIQWSVYGCVQ